MRSIRIFALLLAAIAPVLPAPGGAQQVTLSLERFQKLWDQAHPSDPPPVAPPVPLALESARIEIAAAASTARLRTVLGVVLDSPDWQTLPLAGLGALVSAVGEGVEVALVPAVPAAGERVSAVLKLRGAGRHAVTIESAVPIATDVSAVEVERRLEVLWPPAAWAVARLSGPGVERAEVIEGGQILPDGAGRFALVGEPGRPLRLRLLATPEITQAMPGEPLAFDAATASALAISRARRRLTAFVDLAIRAGRPEDLRSVRLPVPDEFEVLSAAGDRVADWEVVRGALEVRLRPGAARRTSVEVQLAADPADETTVPLLVPDGARTVRAARKVAVRGNDGLLEHLESAASGETIERLTAEGAESFAAGFRAAAGEPLRATPGPGPRFKVTWAVGGEVLTGQVDRLVVEALVGESGRIAYRIWAQVRNGEPTFELALPAGALLLAARREGSEVTLGERPSAWSVPMVVREEAQVIDLEALVPVVFPTARGGRLEIPLPRLQVPASRVDVRVLAPPGFSYRLVEAGKAGGVAPPPGGAPFRPVPLGFTQLSASWSGWSATPPPLAIEVTPLPTRRDAR